MFKPSVSLSDQKLSKSNSRWTFSKHCAIAALWKNINKIENQSKTASMFFFKIWLRLCQHHASQDHVMFVQDPVCQDHVCQGHVCQDHVMSVKNMSYFWDHVMFAMSFFKFNMFCQHVLSTCFANMFCQHVLPTCFENMLCQHV